MDEAYLAHFGIKGMKWGVRRYQNKDGTLTPEGKRREAKKDIRNSRKEASKNRSMLSDEELDQRIKRLEKEKRLRELTEAEVSPGKAYAKKTIDRYGNQIAAAVVTAAGALLVKQIFTSPTDTAINVMQKAVKLQQLSKQLG